MPTISAASDDTLRCPKSKIEWIAQDANIKGFWNHHILVWCTHLCEYGTELKNNVTHYETEQIKEIYTVARERVNLSRNIYIYLFILHIHIHEYSW